MRNKNIQVSIPQEALSSYENLLPDLVILIG